MFINEVLTLSIRKRVKTSEYLISCTQDTD